MKNKDIIVIVATILIGCGLLIPSIINCLYNFKTKNWILSNAYIIKSSIAYPGVVSNKTGSKTPDTYVYQIKYFVNGKEIIGNVFSKSKYDKVLLIKYNPQNTETFVSIDSLNNINAKYSLIGLIFIFLMVVIIFQDYKKRKNLIISK